MVGSGIPDRAGTEMARDTRLILQNPMSHNPDNLDIIYVW